MTQTITPQHQHLSSESIANLFEQLPNYIKTALLAKSNEMECSLEATIEMAIATFLDEDALSFEDCLLSQRLKES
ncbi:MAG: hypothetical protein F6J87_02690 [Spirulina sp. SIO3F2]|nr:hypothetical protein [Spirulina sp. SIO3F2]